uniref:hypothetical protein n=1 Tax=Pseudoalteromonas sp. 43-MNA-CIBAN-0464 TaxID=3140425 RepID=UPI00332A2929
MTGIVQYAENKQTFNRDTTFSVKQYFTLNGYNGFCTVTPLFLILAENLNVKLTIGYKPMF